jgi:hypothetical protein
MKRKFKILVVTIALLAVAQGCSDLLEENPKTVFTSDYFNTKQGLQDGLNAAYAYLRFQYGTNPSLGLNVTGTDEFTFGPEPNYNSSGDNQPHKLLGTYDVAPSAGYLLVTFNRTFPPINTLNALIEFAPNVAGLTDSERTQIIAQARYLRAHYYYLLVGQFGAVPIDLGSGELKTNTIPYTGFNRLDPDLLEKNFQVMIDDLTYASQNLMDARPAGEFRLSKAVAFHLLSKIYLFRSYNPDLVQAGDAQAAYDAAIEVINNQGLYGVTLMADFGTVHAQSNEYNREVLFGAERIPLNNLNNEYTNPSGIGDRENMASNCFTSNYEQPTLLSPSGADVIGGRPFAFQRPLRKLAPTRWLTETAFADKLNDSRYHNSFRTVYTVNTQDAPGTTNYATFVSNMANLTPPRVIGDTAFFLADSPAQAAAMGVTGGTPFGTKYYRVYSSNNWYSNQLYPGPPAPGNVVLVFPSLKKYDDVNRAAPNDASGRPMPIFRLAETYLQAAEAAFQLGNTAEAATLINVLRTRAAYRPGLSAGELSTRVTAMQITAGDIDLDFILDERARELCGEMMRWVDLAMRGDAVFLSRVNLWQHTACDLYHNSNWMRSAIPIKPNIKTLDIKNAQDENKKNTFNGISACCCNGADD